MWDQGKTISQIAANLNCSIDCVKERLHSYPNYSIDKSLQRWLKNKAISVKQFDLNGNFIKEYESITIAARETSINYNAICNVVNGKFVSTHNFQWCKAGEEYRIQTNLSNRTTKTSVMQLDFDEVPIQMFESYLAAARSIEPNNTARQKVIANAIGRVCKGDRRSAYNYKWRKVNEYEFA